MPTALASSASISSIARPAASAALALCRPASIQKQPIRLAMKLTVSLARTTCLPRRSPRNASKRRQDGRGVVSPRDQLDQPHHVDRIEEMGHREVALQALGQAFDQRAQRNAGGVGADHGARAPQRLEALEQRPLGRQILDHRLADPVVAGDRLEVADRDRRCRSAPGPPDRRAAGHGLRSSARAPDRPPHGSGRATGPGRRPWRRARRSRCPWSRRRAPRPIRSAVPLPPSRSPRRGR